MANQGDALAARWNPGDKKLRDDLHTMFDGFHWDELRRENEWRGFTKEPLLTMEEYRRRAPVYWNDRRERELLCRLLKLAGELSGENRKLCLQVGAELDKRMFTELQRETLGFNNAEDRQ